MKNLFFVLTVSLSLGFMSCSDDDGDGGPSFSFVDQTAQGTINGKAFTLGEASASNDTDNSEISFDLYDDSETFTDVCGVFGFGDEVNVFFTLPSTVGVYQLSFDLSSFDGLTATLFDPDEVLNIIATEGAIEILTITETEVTGRLDVRDGQGSSVNGNFTATLCE